MWALAWRLISERPISGWGFGSIPSLALQYAPDFGSFSDRVLTHFHNLYLDFGVEYGLVFGALIVGVTLWLLANAWHGSLLLEHRDWLGP